MNPTDKEIEEQIKESTKFWTEEDFSLVNESMKNIAERPIWDAIYQAKKWALLEARASTVKIYDETERLAWFDKEIKLLEFLIETTSK